MALKTADNQPAVVNSDRVRGIVNDIESALMHVFSYRDAGACVIDCADMRIRITRQQVCVGATKSEGTYEGGFVLYDGDIIHVHVNGAFRQSIVLEVNARNVKDVHATKGEREQEDA